MEDGSAAPALSYFHLREDANQVFLGGWLSLLFFAWRIL
jgi:hypothetical protein